MTVFFCKKLELNMQDFLYMTKEGLDKLIKEYENLRQRRKQVAQRIHVAREFGDISENSEYEDAKNEQSFVEGKIQELENKIKRAKIIAKNSNGKAAMGSKVKLKIDDQIVEYTIVSSSESDPSQGKISAESPLGYSLIGKSKNETVETTTPNGKLSYKIIEVK
jgi:transcription elongation factor GreA